MQGASARVFLPFWSWSYPPPSRSRRHPQEELAFGIEAVRTSLPDLPTVDSVVGVVMSHVAPTVSEFLDIFDSPVDIDLESDNVWPMPAPLVF